MKILINGASGLIGSQLQKSFAAKGYEMILATRHKPEQPNQIFFNAETGFRDEDLPRLDSIDAAINLSGENIAERWTAERKRRIYDSRILTTKKLVETFGKLPDLPKVFISASATGYYGSRDEEILTEESAAGDNFVAEICRDWECEAFEAENLGIRTVALRTGVVLSKDGGALSQMLTPFNFGLGGTIGSGKQWMSWIALEDEVGIVNFALENENVCGAINAVAPHPVVNYEFVKTLGEVMNRPTILPLPEFAVKLLFGEMGESLLLDSAHVVPKKLEEMKFEFKFPDLKPALEDALKTGEKE